MSSITLDLSYNVRDNTKPIHNFSIFYNVSSPYFEKVTDGDVSRGEKKTINEPEWTYQHNTGLSSYFRKHNGFRDQERYNRVSRNYVLRQGTFAKYYVTSYSPDGDELYHEDNNRVVERVFDVPFLLSFQPEIDLYNRLGIQAMDEFESHLHMMLFYELNYASLRRCGIAPLCPESEHNPVWSQRGYEAFRYHGYTFSQIGPKAGDKIKLESFDSLYEIESVKDASPEYQHRWRKYWFKIAMKEAFDTGQTVSDEVLNDPGQQGFINDMLGQMDEENENTDGNAFDVSDAVDELKKDVLFRPPEVEPDVEDISVDSNFYPNANKFGEW